MRHTDKRTPAPHTPGHAAPKDLHLANPQDLSLPPPASSFEQLLQPFNGEISPPISHEGNQDSDDAGSGDDDEESTPKKRRGNKNPPSPRKVTIEFIQDKSKRHISFSKRKAGIMKKAYELSTLTGTEVLLLAVSETGMVYTYATSKLQPIVTERRGKELIQACLDGSQLRSPSQQGHDEAPQPMSEGSSKFRGVKRPRINHSNKSGRGSSNNVPQYQQPDASPYHAPQDASHLAPPPHPYYEQGRERSYTDPGMYISQSQGYSPMSLPQDAGYPHGMPYNGASFPSVLMQTPQA